MSSTKLTPKEEAGNAFFNRCPEQETFNFFAKASPTELQEFIHNIPTHDNSHWFHRGHKVALEISLAEHAAKTAEKLSQQTDKLIQHTEQLTKQTEIHIQHSEKLTRQTDILVTESRRLRLLNWGLIILTFGLLFLTAGLLWIDWHRELIH